VQKIMSPRTSKFTIWFAAIVVLAAVSACTATRLAYNNAAVVLNYYLDDFVDLTSAQKAWLSPRWNKVVEWHRENELPIYKKILLQSKDQLSRPITTADAEGLSSEVKAALARAVDYLMPDIVEFVAQLSPAQIDFLERKFDKENAKRAKDIAKPAAERKKRQLERYVENFEDDFGKLSPEQTAKIEEVISALPLLDEHRHAQSKRGQTDMLKLLREHGKNPAILAATLKARMTNPEANRSEAYQALITEQERQTTQLTVWLINSATPKQKAKLVAQLEGYVQDVSGLLKR
jgi:Family of unknown function (DUF6279)